MPARSQTAEELRRRQDALRECVERFQATYETTGGLILALNLYGTSIDVNRGIGITFELSVSDLIGQRFFSFLAPGSAGNAEERLLKALLPAPVSL